MMELSVEELESGYFEVNRFNGVKKIIHTVNEYDGGDTCYVACTQLSDRYSDKECRQILKDWIAFFEMGGHAIKKLYIYSHVPQRLFNAVCCQNRIEELFLKWGRYSDLSPLTNLINLKYLYCGSCPIVTDIDPMAQMQNLRVLSVQNFKRIGDYSAFKRLCNLEQLVIMGPILGIVDINDIDFIRDMPNLKSFLAINVRCKKNYSEQELNEVLKNLKFS